MCRALSSEGPARAADIIQAEYPFIPHHATKRTCRPVDVVPVFVRDGFIDRYSGARLVFPPVLHLIHTLCPEAFPHHPAWRTEATHPAFNALAATIDHVVPVTMGGVDDPSNWVTTSMARNFAKSNFSLDELGWALHGPGDMSAWDGLIGWYVSFLRDQPELRKRPAIGRWFKAAARTVSATSTQGRSS